MKIPGLLTRLLLCLGLALPSHANLGRALGGALGRSVASGAGGTAGRTAGQASSATLSPAVQKAIARNAARRSKAAASLARSDALRSAGHSADDLSQRVALLNPHLSAAQIERKALQASASRATNPFRKEGLPTRGRIRYVPPKTWRPGQSLPTAAVGSRSGFVDEAGRIWLQGPNHHFRGGRNPSPWEWDVQLPAGDTWARLSRDGRHLDVRQLLPGGGNLGGLLGQ